jgi:hypothetical protein
MKIGFQSIWIHLLFISIASSAFAGTTSAGGLETAESFVHCNTQLEDGTFLDVMLAGDPSSGAYNGVVQMSSLNALYAPIEFPLVHRTQEEDAVTYSTTGLSLVLDLASGTDSLPPQYEAILSVSDVGEQLPVQCEITY